VDLALVPLQVIADICKLGRDGSDALFIIRNAAESLPQCRSGISQSDDGVHDRVAADDLVHAMTVEPRKDSGVCERGVDQYCIA
jgi:hypothetical protein